MCHPADGGWLGCVHTAPVGRLLWANLPGGYAGRGRFFPRFVSRRLEKSPSASSAAGHTSLVVLPSAREAFTPRELVGAYEDFVRGGPQYHDAETGVEASAYRFGARVLLVYEESETGVIVLYSPNLVEG